MGNSWAYVVPVDLFTNSGNWDCLDTGLLLYFITVGDSFLTPLFEKLKWCGSPTAMDSGFFHQQAARGNNKEHRL